MQVNTCVRKVSPNSGWNLLRVSATVHNQANVAIDSMLCTEHLTDLLVAKEQKNKNKNAKQILSSHIMIFELPSLPYFDAKSRDQHCM